MTTLIHLLLGRQRFLAVSGSPESLQAAIIGERVNHGRRVSPIHGQEIAVEFATFQLSL
jgi:hypothetical protein